jgi:uncharacterized protein (DUF4415 family)
MSKQTIGGIHNVLDALLSPAKPPSVLPEVESQKPVKKHRVETAKAIAKETPPQASGARRGRPLGKSTAAGQPKSKVTLWLSQKLVESYRDWSWDARCQFSHLVERALADYCRRERTSRFLER